MAATHENKIVATNGETLLVKPLVFEEGYYVEAEETMIFSCKINKNGDAESLTEEEAIEKAKKFSANPRYARYFAKANREDRVRILAVMPGEVAWRNLYSHHTYSGVYPTLSAAYVGR